MSDTLKATPEVVRELYDALVKCEYALGIFAENHTGLEADAFQASRAAIAFADIEAARAAS